MWERIINQILSQPKTQPKLGSRTIHRFSLKLMAIFGSLFLYSSVFAVGFGEASVRSQLGQPLNVQVPISGGSPEDLIASCIKASVDTIDGDFIASPRMEFIYPNKATGNLPTLVNFTTQSPMVEPAIALSVSLKCGPLMQRTFTLLLDYAEMAPSAAVATFSEPAPVQKTVTKAPTKTSTAPIASSSQAAAAPAKKSAQTTPAARTNATKKSKSAAKNKNRITRKPVEKTAPPKDQLKISNTESLPALSATDLKQAEQKPVDIDLQRKQENNQAQERFAAMLRDEPALLAAQSEALKAEQLKIQKLEAELEKLKLQIQLQMQMNNNKQDQGLPTALIVTNVIVLVLLFVLLLVVGTLWLSLRKARQHPTNLWWDTRAENKPHDEKKNTSSVTSNDALFPNSYVELAPHQPEAKSQAYEQFKPAPAVEPVQHEAHKLPDLEDANTGTFNLFTNRRIPSIQIEELSDSTQEAEFWVSINDPKRAIEILEPQSHNENLTMPVTMLYLLDLYRMVGAEAKYTDLSVRLKRKFNICIPKFDETVDLTKMKSLEDYEHLTSRCCAFWNTNYILPYLESLIVDDREGERVGFELSVYRDILFLISICKELDRTRNVAATA